MSNQTIAVREAYRAWAETYDSDRNPLLALEERTLLSCLGPLRGKRLLDVGCGTGRWVELGGKHGALAMGFDLTAEMLAQAQQKHRVRGRVALAEATCLPVGNDQADLAICGFLLSYVDNPRDVLAELARITKPSGRVIVSDLHPAAIKAGWKRAFRSGSRSYELPAKPRSVDRLVALGRDVGLVVSERIEVTFAEPEREIFHQAGKQDAFAEAEKIPAIEVVLWRKPSHEDG